MLSIRVKGLSKTYGTGPLAFQALKGVDFEARPGEFLMIHGPSGSGKTTLLSILGCVLTPTLGEYYLLGEKISDRSEKELPDVRLNHIGFVFQSHNLIASLTAQENVELLLRMRGRKKNDAIKEAQALLDRVGLGDKYDRRPNELSGGQRQRVGIARALAGDPPILLADEPTASLDGETGMAVTELLKTLCVEDNRTVIVVTHDNRIYHLADRSVTMEDGKIVKETA